MSDFAATKAMFHLPEGVIYLDGNSLGPLPHTARQRVAKVMRDEWGEMLIRGWNSAGWASRPRVIGDRIAGLIGAPKGSVVMGDTLSIKVYQALASALVLVPERRVIVSDTGNFPSDLYMAQGLVKSLDSGHELRIVAPQDVEQAIDHDLAVLLLTEVDYRTGRKHDMAALTAAAHDAGGLAIWDLAHSAGALPIDVIGSGADFAVGCTYKYLNGGPGAPAFIYVAPEHADRVRPALSGWFGHEKPFDFDLDYRPGTGIERMRVGTPSIIALASLDAALDVWENVNIADVRAKSLELSAYFISEMAHRRPELRLASPEQGSMRGSQVSFRSDHGYAVMQALIDRGVIGDFRAPDIIRFGITPLYIDADDIAAAAIVFQEILSRRLWDQPKYKKRLLVT